MGYSLQALGITWIWDFMAQMWILDKFEPCNILYVSIPISDNNTTELEMLSVIDKILFNLVVNNNLQMAAVCLQFWEVYNTNVMWQQ